MRLRPSSTQTRVLPQGWSDLARQLTLLGLAYGVYDLVRALVADQSGERPFADATRIIDLERGLHMFVEPGIQAWTAHLPVLMDFADWIYLNAHTLVTIGVLAFIYLRRNESFQFVRNAFMIAMTIAVVGYTVYPTAPPRLMPAWGFTDSIAQFLGTPHLDSTAAGGLVNFYAAVPSVHVCFALLVALAMARLVRSRAAKLAWVVYPAVISFVVVATGNHYLLDVILGALTAAVSGLAAAQLRARARPRSWALDGVVA